MRLISIDVSEETIRLRQQRASKELRSQWVVFYVALALRVESTKHPSAFLGHEELQMFGDWFFKKPESIGKEVARHLQELAKYGLTDLVMHQGRTKRWRLGLSPKEISFIPSREQCEFWLLQQQWDVLGGLEEVPSRILAWISHTTRALIRLQEGRIEEGLGFIGLAQQENSGSPLLGAIAELVELRLCARQGQYPDPDNWKYLGKFAGNIGKTLSIRASFAQALAPDFDEKSIENLRRLTSRFQSLPDINGLGTAYNALGVLFRRSDKLDSAQKCLRYAIALLIASFDLPTLQAALFNLGHTLYRGAGNEEEFKEALQLIELDREICYSLGIGKDSAQAEVVAGAICLTCGDVPGAQHWLQKGEEIVQTLNSDYNRAEMVRLQARILWVQAWQEKQGVPKNKALILAKYGEALDLMLQAGFPPNEIEDEMSRVRRGEEPSWAR